MQEVIGKMGEGGVLEEYQQRRKEYNSRRLKNELKRAAHKTKEKYIGSICDKIMEEEDNGISKNRTLLCLKTKKRGWEENTGF
jgi:hypothetical protein